MAEHLEDRPSFTPGRKWRAGFSVVVGMAALLAIVVMANIIGQNYFFRRVTVGSQTGVELSAQTLGLLKSLTNELRITLYYDKSDLMFSTISALATEYRLANPLIEVETVDYTRDTAAAQRVKAKYKLDSPTEKDLVIFDCNDRVKYVNGDALVETKTEQVPSETSGQVAFEKRRVAFNGEMLFTAMLLAVKSPEPMHVYYLTGHREHAVGEDEDPFGYSKFIGLLMKNYLQAQPITLVTNGVPENCNLLVVAGPSTRIPEIELNAISKYLDSGGRMLVLFNFTAANKPTGLEGLLQNWGINVSSNIVLDPGHSPNRDKDIIISKFSTHPVVNPLQQSAIYVYSPRLISEVQLASSAADAPKVTPLAFTSADSVLEGTEGPPAQHTIGVAAEKGAVAGVSSARGTARIVVLGDSLVFENDLLDQVGNRDLATYAVNWLVDRLELIQGLGPRPIVETRLVMSDSQLTSARWILLGGLPGGILMLGALVWLRRRN